jgi:Ca2+-transporting ATPase
MQQRPIQSTYDNHWLKQIVMNDSLIRSSIPILFLLAIVWFAYQILSGFILALVWAGIIAYLAWSPYLYLKSKLGERATLSALLMTTLIGLLISLIIFWLIALLHNEVKSVYQAFIDNIDYLPHELPEQLRAVPGLEEFWEHSIEAMKQDKSSVIKQALVWIKQGLGQLSHFFGNLSRNLITLGFVIVILFFCFRHGQQIILQLQQGLFRYLGDYHQVYLVAAGATIQAVVYGIVLAALGQGIIAGIGYAVAGVKAPVLLGAVTAILALVPMGAMLVWSCICVLLLVTGQFWQAIGLLIWGLLAVSTVDNIIRPLVISGTSQVPFLVVMFGVLGGLSAFGVIGIFIGPVILSVLLAIWHTWLNQHTEPLVF